MPRSGGNYSLPSGNPVVVGTEIDPSWANNTLSDIGAELTNSVPRDGQAPPTANLPMGGFKHTNAALATASTDYARADQAQSGVLAWLTSVSGTNTITASILPTISSYAVGATYRFVSAGANTGAVTLNINGVGAATVSKFGSTALQAGDIQSGAVVTVTYDGTRFQMVTPATETGLYPAGTANGVLYLDGSKQAVSGSALTFDGTNLGIGAASPGQRLAVRSADNNSLTNIARFESNNAAQGVVVRFAAVLGDSGNTSFGTLTNHATLIVTNNTEVARFDSFGNFGVGTASPGAKLDVVGETRTTVADAAVSHRWTATTGRVRFRPYVDATLGAFFESTNPAESAYLPLSFGGSTIELRAETTITTRVAGTVRTTLDASGNFGLNTATFGTSAAGVLALGTGTAPTTGPADTVQLFSVDRSAGNTIPAIRCEGSGVTNAGITNTTVTNKIAVQVNGTIYYLLATTNAT